MTLFTLPMAISFYHVEPSKSSGPSDAISCGRVRERLRGVRFAGDRPACWRCSRRNQRPRARPRRRRPRLRPSPSWGAGYAAYRAGDYHAAVPSLRAAVAQGSAQQGLGAVRARRERVLRRQLPRARATTSRSWRAAHGRPAQMAPFRIADCLWMEGDRAKAAASYARLAKTATARTGDVALARFRVAEQAAERDRDAAPPRSSWPSRAISRRTRWPTRRCAGSAPARPRPRRRRRRRRPRRRRRRPPRRPPPISRPPTGCSRAESLSKDRHWDEALAELAKLPATLPPDLAAERDYQIGMTKFHMRRDYPTAGALLLGAVDRTCRATRRRRRSSTARARCRAWIATTRRSPAIAR